MLASHRGSTRRNRRSSLTETDNDSRKAHTLFGRSIECAKSLGLCIRDSTSSDADGLGRAHVRFDMESMDACTIPTGYQTGIMSIIEGDDNILLLTRELADQRFKATKKKKGSNDFSCEVLGFVYSFDEQKGRAVSCYIAEVFVDREVRGQGLGELLLIAALSRALARGVSQAHLLVATQNFPAVALYKKHGFIGCSEDSGDVTHDLVMRLSTQENFFDKQLVLLLVRN